MVNINGNGASRVPCWILPKLGALRPTVVDSCTDSVEIPCYDWLKARGRVLVLPSPCFVCPVLGRRSETVVGPRIRPGSCRAENAAVEWLGFVGGMGR